MPKAAAADPDQTADPAATSVAPLEIFRAGRHTAVSGQTFEFTERDVLMTAVAYTPSRHEAPLVVGHPAVDAPAYGWVSGLSARSGQLSARVSQVDPAFAELVRAGRFKKISASFYAPDAPGNPAPGVYYLRHVGFLGAQPPAVKGLRSPQFAASDEGVIEFSEWDDVANAGLWRALREWVIGKFGLEEADRAVPGYAVAQIETGAQNDVREAQAAATAPTTPVGVVPAFAEEPPPVTEHEKAAIEAENARLRSELQAALATQAAARQTQVHAQHVAFAEGLTAQGRWPVAGQAVLVATLDALALAEQPVEFAEGAAASRPLADALQDQLGALPVQVAFGEVATTGRAAGDAGVIDFAAPAGATISPEGLALHRRVQAYQAAHPGTDYVTALSAVQLTGA